MNLTLAPRRQAIYLLTRAWALMGPALTWWTEELRSLWEEAVARVWPSARIVTRVLVNDRTASIVQKKGDVLLHVIEIDSLATPPTLPSELLGARATVVLPEKMVLVKRLQLPATAESRLRNVIVLRIEREMPFRADSVYFDCVVADRNPDAQTIDVEIAVVRRACVDRWLGTLRSWGLRPASIGVPHASGETMRFAFGGRTAEGHAADLHRWDRPLQVSCGVLLVLLAVLTAWQWHDERRVINAALMDARSSAQAVQSQRARLLTQLETLQLIEMRMGSAPLGAVLAELTRVAPQDTSVQSFKMSAGTVHVAGLTADAPGLVARIDQSPLFEGTSLVSTVAAGLGTGQDRFELTTRMTGSSP